VSNATCVQKGNGGIPRWNEDGNGNGNGAYGGAEGGTDENAMFSQKEFHVVRLNRRKRFLRQPIISRSIARALVLMPESLGIYVDDIRSS
jgi:hypothetical protein